VRATGATDPGAGAERILDDGLDGARAAAAFGAAAEAAVKLLGAAGKILRGLDGTADIVVADDVAGTDDHGCGRPFDVPLERDPFDIGVSRATQKKKRRFEAIPNWIWIHAGVNPESGRCARSSC